MNSRQSFLHRILLADAAASGALGALLALFGGVLSPLLGLSEWLMREVGLILLVWAAGVGWLASRPFPDRRLVWGVIAINVLWLVESFAVLALGWISPTGLGIAFVVGQALVVAAFAELQWLALRRAPRPA